jgi:YidC/Oxa1 family membrane protein insertase
MNKRQTIGLIIMTSMLMIYNYFFLKKDFKIDDKKILDQEKTILKNEKEFINNKKIKEEFFELKNKDLNFKVSNFGANIVCVDLVNFKHEKDDFVKLIKNSSDLGYIFYLEDGRIINTKNLIFSLKDSKENTLVLSSKDDDLSIDIEFKIKDNFIVDQNITVFRLNEKINCKKIIVDWSNNLVPTEKNIKSCRDKTTINYHTIQGNFESLNESSSSNIEKRVSKNINWICLKQKYFSSGFILKNLDAKTDLFLSSIDENDENIVKKTNVKLHIENPKITNQFSFYFGPNDYFKMKKVAGDFSKNIPLGWSLIRFINVFLIIPIFKFFGSFISNVVLIILILVFLIKLISFPVLYKSHISGIKMKLLKPYLEKIKDNFKNDQKEIQIKQMLLYKSAGVNPFASIGLVLIQMPILLAAFNFIPNEIAFRQASFLWVKDLSSYDSILNLPFNIPFYGNHVSLFTIVMTLSTILQTYLSLDTKNQEKNMKIILYTMPVFFMFVLNNFPSALSFYYFVSNIGTILLQYIFKKISNEKKIENFLKKNIENSSYGDSFTKKLDSILNKNNLK